MSEPRYGDNIYELGAATLRCLRDARWPHDKINAIRDRISAAKSYDEAVAVCREYITIKGEP